MKFFKIILLTLSFIFISNLSASSIKPFHIVKKSTYEIKKITFYNDSLKLHGIIYKPIGDGPFPAILFNHGSSLDTHLASDLLGPVFANNGWIFFMPSRRGQGLSRSSGPFIGDQIKNAETEKGKSYAVKTMIQLLQGAHLKDQIAALDWLKQQSYVDKSRIAVAGVSFGGIETVFGMAKAPYCAGIDIAGAAQSWDIAPKLQLLMLNAVKNAKASIFFFQAKNDYNLQPTSALSQEMNKVGKDYRAKIYPSFGNNVQEGHSFDYFGSAIWGQDVFNFLNQNCAKK